MSLPKAKIQSSFFDVSVLMKDFFGPSNRYRLFREKILPVLQAKREQLCALYCEDNGRPALEPVLMLGVSLLQFIEKLPDRKALEHVAMHLGWKYALELEVDEKGFHPTTLVKFRQRLIDGGMQRVGFDAILDALVAEGLVRKGGRQRLDSTHVFGCVAKMSYLECMRETLRLFIEQLGHWGLAESLDNYRQYRERYCESELPWHRLNKQKLASQAERTGRDALVVLEWLGRQPAKIRHHAKALLLKRVFEEQYEVCEGKPTVRKRKKSGAVRNPHDAEAQWSTKDSAKTKAWVGYKAQVAESVPDSDKPKKKGEPTEQFLLEVTTTEAITSDFEGMHRVLEAQAQHHDNVPCELYVDAGYVSDDTLAEAEQQDRKLMGPARPPGNASKTIFDATKFDVDVANRRAICPAGHTSTQCSLINDSYQGKAYLRFEWGSLCDTCSLQKQCTERKDGRRHLSVGPHHDLLQQRRREMKTEAFKLKMHRRAAIEGSISELTRQGARRTRYRGLAKTALANYLQGAAVNINRWLRLVQWQCREPIKAA